MIGGAEILAGKLLPALCERGYEFTVITSQRPLNRPNEEMYKGIPVYRFPFRENLNEVSQVIEIKQRVKKLKVQFAPELIHISAVAKDHVFQLLTAGTYRVPLLVTLHNVLAREAEKSDSWLGRIIASADWVSCVSASVLSATRKTLPSMASRSSVVYNGLDIPAVASQAAPADAPKLLCLGRLKIRKGFDVALKAFVSVVGRFPEARLIVAGDGPERLSLERQAVQLGIGGVVDFIGWVAPEDVPELVAKVTAVVMPSRHEPFGLVALDAALTSRPIVASRVGGLTEVVAHGKTGLLVEPNDSAALAEALVFLLDNRDLAVEMGRIARRRAQTIFSWKRCVDAYDELYQKLAHRAG
jgi:glycosyltransferase involved in cell wall biosynthesis